MHISKYAQTSCSLTAITYGIFKENLNELTTILKDTEVTLVENRATPSQHRLKVG